MTLTAARSSRTIARSESRELRRLGPASQYQQSDVRLGRAFPDSENLAPSPRLGYLRTMSGDQVWIGSVLAERWEVLDLLGRGGMGAVYRARHVHLGTDVAIKVLQNTAQLEGSEIARFYRESRLIGSLQHDHIVRVQDTGKAPSGDFYFVMEYLRGPNLRALLLRDGPLPWARTRAIVLQVCDALSAMHDRGVIHRDLKPHNIVLDPRPGRLDFVKLLDFGVAKPMGEDLTQAGVLLGTPAYMAPEYLYGAAPDRRIDIFALGIIAFELLTGQQPSGNANANARILGTRGVPPKGGEAIVRALARDPDYRYDDARAFAVALSAVLDEPAADADETTRVRPLSRAAAATSRPPSAPSTAATAPRPISLLPSRTSDGQALTRREDNLAFRFSDEDRTVQAPAALKLQTEFREPGGHGGSGLAVSADVDDETVPEHDDLTQIQEPRKPAAVFVLPGPPQLEPTRARDDSRQPARSDARETAPPSMSAHAVTVPKPPRTRGMTRRIAALVFSLVSLGVLTYWWIYSSPPRLDDPKPQSGVSPEPAPPVESMPTAPDMVTSSPAAEPSAPTPSPLNPERPFPDEPESEILHNDTPASIPELKVTGPASYANRLAAIQQKIRKCGEQAIRGESVELEISVDGRSGKATVKMKTAILEGEPAATCVVQAIQRLKFPTFVGEPFVKRDTFTF